MTLTELLTGCLSVINDDRETTYISNKESDDVVRDSDAIDELATLDQLIFELNNRLEIPEPPSAKGKILAAGLEMWARISNPTERKFCSDRIHDLLIELDLETGQQEQSPEPANAVQEETK